MRAKGAQMTGKDTKMTIRRRYCGAGEKLGGPGGVFGMVFTRGI